MNFLNRLVIPESNEHLTLLKYLLVIVTILFVTYTSIALVASTFSAYFDVRGKRKGNRTYLKFARNLIDLAAPNRGLIFSLAVLPLVTAILIYTQLLYGMNLGISTYLSYAAVFYFVGFYFLYSYNRSSHLDTIYRTFRQLAKSHASEVDSEVSTDVDSFERSITNIRRKAGRRGAVLLWIATWIFVGTTRLAFTPDRWATSSFLTVLFSSQTFWSFVDYVVSALVVTSAAVLFFFFVWDNGIVNSADNAYRSFVKKFSLTVGIIFVAIEPLLIFFEIQNLPQHSLSSATFGLAGIAMFIAFLLLHMFYSMLKDSRINLGTYAFIGVVLLVSIWAAKDEIAFSHATRVQDQVLGQRYAEMVEDLNPNRSVAVISGEDIFNGRCSACHRFDVKLVGPPYNQTLPNFVGKMDSLEDFSMNPRQVVPGYPPMPNQGLKPAEVKAVAEYIMGVYLKTHPQAAKKDTATVKM